MKWEDSSTANKKNEIKLTTDMLSHFKNYKTSMICENKYNALHYKNKI